MDDYILFMGNIFLATVFTILAVGVIIGSIIGIHWIYKELTGR